MKENIRFSIKLMIIPVIIGAIFVCNYCYVVGLLNNKNLDTREYVDYKFTAITVEHNQEQAISDKININTADFDTLCLLHGVGKVFAQNIIDYRTYNGDFKTISEIRAVKGFGDKKFLKIRDDITTGDPK